MGKDHNLVIVKDQSSLIYVPDLDKYDAVSKFPLLFFSLRLFSFRQEFWEVRCGFHLLKLYCLECKLFRSGVFPPVAFIRMALLLYVTFYLYFSLCSEMFHCHECPQKHLRALFLYPDPR